MAMTISEKILSFVYGNKTIKYTLLFVERKTLEISVLPDSQIVVKAPVDSDMEKIRQKLIKRARWILKQIKYFKQFEPKTPTRCYVNGETHRYLGKQFRLKLLKSSKESVKLTRGYFIITSPNELKPQRVKILIDKWYLEKARIKFKESIDNCWPRFNNYKLNKPGLLIKVMKKRWGSLSEKGMITLNTNLIKAPTECIDYVVTHELCHLIQKNHNLEFYKLLGSIYPGWEKIKHKLELSMV